MIVRNTAVQHSCVFIHDHFLSRFSHNFLYFLLDSNARSTLKYLLQKKVINLIVYRTQTRRVCWIEMNQKQQVFVVCLIVLRACHFVCVHFIYLSYVIFRSTYYGRVLVLYLTLNFKCVLIVILCSLTTTIIYYIAYYTLPSDLINWVIVRVNLFHVLVDTWRFVKDIINLFTNKLLD